MENKTCGQKTAKISADRTQPAAVLQPGNNFKSLGRHLRFRYQSCQHTLRPPAAYTPVPTGRHPFATFNLLYRVRSSFCRPTPFLPAWPANILHIQEDDNGNKNHWQIISVVVWFIIIKDDVATWNAISNNWESRATISISNIHFLEIKVFNNPGVVLVYYFVVSRVKAICVLRCDYKEVIWMMMRFYNSRVEHIVTKNNEFFE